MPKFGLIGDPIAKSLSPTLFQRAYSGKYTYDLIQTSDFQEAWDRFLSDYQAINVTAPFKVLAFQTADILSPEAQRCEATNLCVKTPDGIKAYNSDYLGVRKLLELSFPNSPYLSPTSSFGHNPLEEFSSAVSANFVNHQPLSSVSDTPENADASHTTNCTKCCEDTLTAGFSLNTNDLDNHEDFSTADTSHNHNCIKTCEDISTSGLEIFADFEQKRTTKLTAAIIGFGGAGKAALCAAEDCGFETKLYRHNEISNGLEADVVIYTLPSAVDGIDKIHCDTLIEANYKNPALSQRKGFINNYIPGTSWLLWQAILGYSLMTGETPDKRAMELL